MNSEKQQVEDNIIDVEEYFAAGKEVPSAKQYRIRLDKQQYVVDVGYMTGREILALAGKTPEKFLLRLKAKGGVEPVDPDQVVSFLAPGVERFMTIPNEVTEGDAAAPRVQFNLLPADREYLDSLGLCWEAVAEGAIKAVVIYKWPLPKGYNVGEADVHVRLPPGYPDSQIDMAYFSPILSRTDNRSIGGLSLCQFDGRQWQQWSRHRTRNSTWRIGEDDLGTHMPLVRDWLEREFRK
ncbi:multiubiquitin domain-containing protein [Nitrogeniibacter aestuarii]|uniref:multiubiquitin domain-containing protein n=1 Tax=Nitrogeniibacter aestuarii TaxID=2815343 RepID=UPI001D12C9BB|nr:multiubiquitin domain-containing protein [Nitrogeniibacter aestuarii]